MDRKTVRYIKLISGEKEEIKLYPVDRLLLHLFSLPDAQKENAKYTKYVKYGAWDDERKLYAKDAYKKFSLLIAWRKQWKNEYPDFTEYYIQSYIYSRNKAEKNRAYNFWEKAKFVRHLKLFTMIQVLTILTFVAYTIVCFFTKRTFNSVSISAMATIETFLIVTGIWILISDTKWAGIKKYQETWARHSYQIQKMDLEMVKYLSQTEPCDKAFVENILKIMNKNAEKFRDNLENKEISPMENVEKIGKNFL